jgi:hypothetical protein
MTMNETLQLVGGVLGVIAFFWKVWDSFNSYIYLHLELSQDKDGFLTAKTTIENKGLWSKSLDYAFLLIGREEENPQIIAKELIELERKNRKLSDELPFEQIKPRKPIYTESGRALIPLPFFYSEQSNIGDEKLTCRSSIDTSKFEKGVPYSVRFTIFGRGRVRSTQDLFILNQQEKEGSEV